MKKTYLIYMVLSLGIFALGIWIAQGNFWLFIDPASFMIVFIPVILMMLTANSPVEIIGAFKAAMNNSPAEIKEVQKALVIMETTQGLTYKVSILACIFGIVLMLASGWDVKFFAKGFSVAILGVVYALFAVILITMPFKMALKKKLIDLK